MANAKKLVNTQVGNSRVVCYFTLTSDGTQESSTVIYDSSVVTGLLKIPDPLTSVLVSIRYASNSVAGLCRLNWDASSPVTAWALPLAGNYGKFNFQSVGGLPNQGGTGITGDITLTTTGLATGESLSIILEVKPS